MSILIKGMEMSKTCADCRLTTWNGEDTVCPFSRVSALNIGRQVDCPLIEVPEHGRLIDADALLVSIKEARKKQPEIAEVYDDDYFLVAEWLVSAPTVIPADKESET